MFLIEAFCPLSDFFDIEIKKNRILFLPAYEDMRVEMNMLLTFLEKWGKAKKGPNYLELALEPIEAQEPERQKWHDETPFRVLFPNLNTVRIIKDELNMGETIELLKEKMEQAPDEFCEFLANDLAHYIVDFKENHEKTNPKIEEKKIKIDEEITFTFLRKVEFPKPMIVGVLADGTKFRLLYGGLMWRNWETNKTYTIKNIGKKYRNNRDKVGYYDFIFK